MPFLTYYHSQEGSVHLAYQYLQLGMLCFHFGSYLRCLLFFCHTKLYQFCVFANRNSNRRVFLIVTINFSYDDEGPSLYQVVYVSSLSLPDCIVGYSNPTTSILRVVYI